MCLCAKFQINCAQARKEMLQVESLSLVRAFSLSASVVSPQLSGLYVRQDFRKTEANTVVATILTLIINLIY